jgi:hypothetical protein
VVVIAVDVGAFPIFTVKLSGKEADSTLYQYDTLYVFPVCKETHFVISQSSAAIVVVDEL